MLGRVDGLYQDEHEDKRDDSCVVSGGLLAAKGEALEAFRLSDQLLDPRPQLVKLSRKEARPNLGVRTSWDHRQAALRAGRIAVGLGILPLVSNHCPRRNVRVTT